LRILEARSNSPEKAKAPRRFVSYLGITLKGFCMGSADVVPGVSGGTMAFILGIYEELIRAIRSFDLTFVRLLFSLKIKEATRHVEWRFLLALGIGILLAVFSLARLLSWLLENRPVLIWSFFFGLILASIFTVGRRLQRWRMAMAGWIMTGTLGAFLLVGMVPVSTPDAPWFVFLCGAVAICAMILPGISGAFILVILGKYQYVLEAVNDRDILTLAVVATGACLGLISFARILSWLFKKHHDVTIALLSGLMLGSLRKVWPWKKTILGLTDGSGHSVPVGQTNFLPTQWDGEVTVAVTMMLFGLFAVFVLNRLAESKAGPYETIEFHGQKKTG
jgi:putative membrane protein